MGNTCATRRLTGLFILLVLCSVTRAAELVVGVNFTGSTLGVESTFIPPDNMGAVGPDHVVEMINGRYSVYRKKDGTRIDTRTLTGFWQDAGVVPEVYAFDPRVLYDPHSERWFAVSVDNPRADNAVLVAVSRSSDPTEGWNGVAIGSASAHWADFPTMGMNTEGIFIAAEMQGLFPQVRREAALLVVPKQDLLGPPPLSAVVTSVPFFGDDSAASDEARESGLADSAPENLAPETGTPRQVPLSDAGSRSTAVRVTRFRESPWDAGWSIQPIVDLDNLGMPAAFLAQIGIGTVEEFLRFDVSGDVLSPTLHLPSRRIPVERYHGAFLAYQPPPKARVEIFGGNKFQSSIVRRHGSLWGVQTVWSPDSRGPAQRWFRIDADTHEVLQEGEIIEPDMEFYYGSIAVNEFEDVVIGFNGSSVSEYIGSYAVLGETRNGVTEFGTPVLLQAGQAGYEVIRRDDRNRWGDYSATVNDPADPRVFWTFQEYVSAEDVWSTRITQLVVFSDRDGDGIPDDDDACPDSDLRETVVIGECDSGVANVLDGDGCTISDRVTECGDKRVRHGHFVSCVAHLTNALRSGGVIMGREKGAIQSCAASAGVSRDATDQNRWFNRGSADHRLTGRGERGVIHGEPR